MTEVQIADRESRHLGRIGDVVRVNATGSFTVEIPSVGFRTFTSDQLVIVKPQTAVFGRQVG